MKLFFDARFTRFERHDGISRYGSSLLEALIIEAAQHDDVQVTAIINDERQLNLLPACDHITLNSPLSPTEPFIARKLNDLGADVVFSTMQTMGSWGRNYKLILTLHDLIYYDHPEPPHNLPAVIRGAWRLYHKAYWPQRLMLNRADAVAAVSQTTADLIAQHHLTDKPVRVISNAATPLPELPQRTSGHNAKSLVYMGAFLPYKNAESLIRALEFLPGYTLHLASGIEPARETQLRALIPDNARVKFHRGITDEVYHQLLDQSTALVTASKAEGFGLPLVEAMMRGTPVAVSDLPIFHEIAGDTAQYFDPDSPESIAAAVMRLEDVTAWRTASQSGPSQAATFSWQKSAKALLELACELRNDGH